MADALRDLKFAVADEYLLIDAEVAPQRTEVVIAARGETQANSYRPFDGEHAFLYRDFAWLPQDPESIIGFARRFGYLGVPITVEASLDNDTSYYGPDDIFRPVWVETITSWRQQIEWMQHAVGLSDAVQRENSQTIAKWAKNWRSWRYLFYDFGVTAAPTKDLIWNATEVLRTIVTNRLTFARVVPQVVRARQEPALRMSYAPTTLLGALWIQMALAITEDRTIRTCEHCARVFEVSKEPTGARTRSDSQFCSNKCKTADRRRRINDAKRLWLAGASVPDIKVAIDRTPPGSPIDESAGTKLTTIEGWIAGWQAERGVDSERKELGSDGTV
jgi:hypothetical protein